MIWILFFASKVMPAPEGPGLSNQNGRERWKGKGDLTVVEDKNDPINLFFLLVLHHCSMALAGL